jgi:hypothetical protein
MTHSKKDNYSSDYCNANSSYFPLNRVGGWGLECNPVLGASTHTIRENFESDIHLQCFDLPTKSEAKQCLDNLRHYRDVRFIKDITPQKRRCESCYGMW